jgi:hypothetical protein
MRLIREAGSCKLYSKGYVGSLRYFISSKNDKDKLKRYQIQEASIPDFKNVNDENFVRLVEEILIIARAEDPSHYYEN